MKLSDRIDLWLKKPLPFFETTKQKFTISIVFGIFITIFLILFDFSSEGDHSFIQILKAGLYGFITFLVLFFYSYFLPILIPSYFNSEKWNMGRSIVYGILLVVSIGLFNALFAFKFDNPNNRVVLFPFLIAVVQKTFIISIIPTLMFNLWLEKRLYKKYELGSEIANSSLIHSESDEKNDLKIEIDEEIKISEQDLVYIKAEGNYCQVYYIEDLNQKKLVLRNTLKNIEDALQNSKRIVRCHKSYIINLDKVKKVCGNARGYTFIVDDFNFNVPVSRTISKDLVSRITL
jgi:hypothetical protein